ncbi:HAD family hydrolase [Romboutsia sp.]|uniref:HAD family hydrolase n=1 Tax=Romboutsia sp. TaxID=1965302 RepID=UPI003F2C3392
MKLAVFDFDRTLFPKDTIPYLMKQWYKLQYPKNKIIKIYIKLLPAYVVYKLGIGGTETNVKLRNIAVEGFDGLFKGMSKNQIEEFFHKSSESLYNELNKDIVNKIIEAQQKGMHTVIISGAYEPLLQIIGKNLNIDTVIGTKLPYDSNEFYNHNQKLILVEGDKKVEELEKYFTEEIDWQSSYFYTDSIRDIKLLELVGNPVAVNPDTHLLNHAQKQNWQII